MPNVSSTAFLGVHSTSSDAVTGFIIASRLQSSHVTLESKAMLI